MKAYIYVNGKEICSNLLEFAEKVLNYLGSNITKEDNTTELVKNYNVQTIKIYCKEEYKDEIYYNTLVNILI